MTGRPRKHPLPEEIECAGCGERFQQHYHTQRYHDQKCFLKHYNQENADGHSNRGAKKGGATTGKLLAAKRDPDKKTYRKVAGQHEHRAVAEALLGRKLTPDEVVHHEDLDRRNNEPANLIVFPRQADHAKHHNLGHPGSPCGCPGIRLGVI